MSGLAKGIIGTKTRFARTLENNKSKRLFSFGFSLLNIFPYMLLLLFALAAGVKYGFFTINKALAALLFVLVAVYFALPRMAQKIQAGLATAGNHAQGGEAKKVN